jgi:glutamate/tyrosine decarboxylase-like PLP-dependent enzyme
MKDLLSDAAQRATAYLESLPERRVRPDADALAKLTELVEPLADAGMPAKDVLARLDRLASSASVAMAGPRFFGFVIGGSLPASLAATWLSGAWDQCTGLHEVTPATAMLESQSLEWMLDLLNLPRDCEAGFVTGATVANFTALAAARHSVLKQAGWDVEADGLFGAPPISVVMSEESHPSVVKSLGMLGLGRSRVARVPSDAQGRIRVDKIPAIRGPTVIITQVGNVNTGRVTRLGRSAISRGLKEPGFTWTAPSGCGRPPPRNTAISSPAWRTPIPGQPMLISGSTCPMTAVSRSFAMARP